MHSVREKVSSEVEDMKRLKSVDPYISIIHKHPLRMREKLFLRFCVKLYVSTKIKLFLKFCPPFSVTVVL